jgi:hypothetical protein
MPLKSIRNINRSIESPDASAVVTQRPGPERLPLKVLTVSSRPDCFSREAFGKNVERLSYKRDKVYTVEMAAQTDDFEDFIV